ncbi:DNA polymerase III subunit gamma/tau [Ningiella sp. W23]|uniref:DNA polymerase III subunit gamma/tau n=1 Tax=Ningiella sp. W23 TaxID=3023715 RepID=UPI0037564760
MSYQVLARKWRPQTFAELVGQQHVVDAITNALENNKLHHAYLFTGTRGVGKTTIARIFSKSLNCEQGQSATPCGKCDTCLDISEGRFVDLLEIDAASRTKVEDTRDLLDNVQYKPTRGRFKVYLIDEVHMLSKHSFNALLKTLEEPPPHVKFLLATTDPQKLPVTILSRCLQFSLKALSREQIQGQLSYILSEESLAHEPEALIHIARAAAGSMRDALSLTDQAIAQGNNQVTVNTVVSMLGLLDKNQVIKLAKYVFERDGESAMKQLEEICADAPDYAQVLSQLLALIHQVALTQIVPDVCKLDTNSAKPVYMLAKAVNPEHVQLLYQIALNGKRDLPYAPDALTGLQMTIMRMLVFTPAQNIALDVEALKKNEDAPQPLSAESDENKQNDKFEQAKASAKPIDSPNNELPQQEDKRQALDANETALKDTGDDAEEAAVQTMDVSNFEQNQSNLEPEQPPFFDDDSSPAPHAELEQQLGTQPESEASSQSQDDTDSVAHLQDLFAMEDDLASYEKQIIDDSQQQPDTSGSAQPTDSDGITGVKKSESSVDESSVDIPLADALNNESVDDSQQGLSGALESDPAFEQNLENTAETDVAKVESKDGVGSIGEIKAYLDNGEKLVKASQIDKWSRFVDSLDVRGLARQLLIHGRSQGINSSAMVLEINQDHHHLNEQSSVVSITQALKKQYGKDIAVTVKMAPPEKPVENTPYEIQQQIDAMRLAYANEIIETDSAVQELVEAFDGKVIPGSVESR